MIHNYRFLIRIGLGLAFLANALTAFFAPAEFIELLNGSFATNILPVAANTFVVLIGINDVIVALLLFLNIGIRRTALWAAIWIIGVMAVRGAPLEILEEAGFLPMAMTLFLDKNISNQ